MNSKNKPLSSEKLTKNKTNETQNMANQQKINKKLMEKFNITSEEAESIITKIKKKKEINKNVDQEKTFENNTIKLVNPQKNDQSIPKQFTPNESNTNHKISKELKNQNKNNVDTLLSEIIPGYKQSISIELENVNLTFEVATDKIDTIKESFVRTLQRNKSKKMKLSVLKDITFKIYKGEKIGIIGYNGAGKSTLLKLITGIYPPDSGTVKTYGHISPLLSLGAGFDFNYSGRKNIYLNGAVLGYDKNFLKEKENEIIEFSELEEYIDIPIKNYSSGMLAKLGFSIATIVNPDILIIDEILGVGDVVFQKKSHDKIKSLIAGGTTVILVSHSIMQIRELCDKAIWIDDGYLRKIGEVNQVCDEYIKDSEKATKEQIANIEFTTENWNFNDYKKDMGILDDYNDIWRLNEYLKLIRTSKYTEIREKTSGISGIGSVNLPSSNIMIEFDLLQVDGNIGDFFYQFNQSNKYLNGSSLYHLNLEIGKWHHIFIELKDNNTFIVSNDENDITVTRSMDNYNKRSKINFTWWTAGDITTIRFKNFRTYKI